MALGLIRWLPGWLIRWVPGRFPSREIVLDEGALDGLLGGFQTVADWVGLPEVTLQSLAVLGVFLVYALAMLVILNGEMIGRHRREWFSERWRLFAALIASGALSAAGGALWLLEHEAAPVPTRLCDDMVIPAAALLAGGLYLAGPGRTLLACVLLPGALAVVVGWRQEALHIRSEHLAGYQLQVGVLILMVASSRYAMGRAETASRWRTVAMTLAWMSAAGIAVVAASVWVDSLFYRAIFHVAGAGLWMVGGSGAVALKMASRRCEDRIGDQATADGDGSISNRTTRNIQ